MNMAQKLEFELPHPSFDNAGAALDCLIAMANGDSGGSRCAADFLLAWWNGHDWGHFPIMHLKTLDRALGEDVMTILLFLVQGDTVYADMWDRRHEMEALIDRWRDLGELAA
jgi:hypothetical protein